MAGDSREVIVSVLEAKEANPDNAPFPSRKDGKNGKSYFFGGSMNKLSVNPFPILLQPLPNRKIVKRLWSTSRPSCRGGICGAPPARPRRHPAGAAHSPPHRHLGRGAAVPARPREGAPARPLSRSKAPKDVDSRENQGH